MNATVIIPAYNPETNLQKLVDRSQSRWNNRTEQKSRSLSSKSDLLYYNEI